MSDEQRPVVIAAVWADAPSWAFPGLRYFDEHEWPQPGYEAVKRIVGCTKAELLRGGVS